VGVLPERHAGTGYDAADAEDEQDQADPQPHAVPPYPLGIKVHAAIVPIAASAMVSWHFLTVPGSLLGIRSRNTLGLVILRDRYDDMSKRVNG